MASARIHLIISGRVQGVFFRASARKRARELGTTGYVRNLPGREVEIVAEGEKESLDALAAWATHGPPDAQVEEVKTVWEKPKNKFDTFNIA